MRRQVSQEDFALKIEIFRQQCQRSANFCHHLRKNPFYAGRELVCRQILTLFGNKTVPEILAIAQVCHPIADHRFMQEGNMFFGGQHSVWQQTAEKLEELMQPEECIHEVNDNSGICKHCGDYLGWHCPKSPDSVCHYFTFDREDKKVLLISGTIHELKTPRPHQSLDSCIFCREPQERK